MKKQILLSLLLIAAALMPQVAWADIYYTDGSSTSATDTNSIATTLGTSGENTFYYYTEDVTFPGRVEVFGKTHIIVADGVVVNAPAGITVAEGNTLVITGGGTDESFSGTGTLKAGCNSDNPGYDACIGGLSGGTTGTIEIRSGTVYAANTVTGYSAAIGSGYKGTGTIAINISGGNVTAYSCYGEASTNGNGYGAGIGLGRGSAVAGTITVTGGTIKAASSYNYIGYGAGIGSGDDCANSNIFVSLTAATIEAYCSENYHGYYALDGAAIGCGEDGGCDSVTIYSGTIKAFCGKVGATMNGSGIGNGENGGCSKVFVSSLDAVIESYGKYCLSADEVKVLAIGTFVAPYQPYAPNLATVQLGESSSSITSTITDETVYLTDIGKENKYAKITFKGLEGQLIYYKDAKGDVKTHPATRMTKGGTYSGTYYLGDTLDLETITAKGMLHLILLDGCNVMAKGSIVVEDPDTLIISYGNNSSDIAETGKIIVTDSLFENKGDDARIGSREGNICGYIIINGGNITTYSTYGGFGTTSIYGADIGSGYKGSNGSITINGGNIYCHGGHNDDTNSMAAAGIGSGYKATGTVWIEINGGKVQVWPTGNKTGYGAGIGTGQSAEGNANIVINGGDIEAHSSTNSAAYGAGIGTGGDYKAAKNTTINISGGNIYAFSSHNGDTKYGHGAGIGMGNGWSSSYGKVDINITGGTVKAQSGVYPAYGAGIGGGDDGGCGGIIISGTANVKAYNCNTGNTPEGPGIGDGDEDATGELKIYGDECTVDTWGKYGIGNTDDGKFVATVYPRGGTAKVESGDDTYGTNNGNSPQTYTNSFTAKYGTSKWRKISFEASTKKVYYTDENGELQGTVEAINYNGTLPFVLNGGDETPTYYYITGDAAFNVSYTVETRGKVVLILADGVNATAKNSIKVEGDNTLTITTGCEDKSSFAGTGTLTAYASGEENAAIGTGGHSTRAYETALGTIIINDGTVNAYGNGYGAGIGAGWNATTAGGSITINGGTITAASGQSGTSNTYGAGIGGGSGSATPSVSITGGDVTAYSALGSNTGYGAGIGAGSESEGVYVTILDGIVKAASSESGTSYGAGIGGAYSETIKAIIESGAVRINGDVAKVTAIGAKSIAGETANASGVNENAVVEYGASSSDYTTYEAHDIDLLNYNDTTVSGYNYAHIYFTERPSVSVYYTQEDGSVSAEPVLAYDCVTYVPDTIGDGTDTPTYYYIYTILEQTDRPVVNGNVVLVMADNCDATLAGGITVEEGNTLTITTGDTTNVYQRTAKLDVGTNSTDNAAIGSTQPDGNSSSYAGHTAGTINIYDGTITAHVAEKGSNSETFAAAIGGGAGNGNAGTINITGGNVTAYSAYSGTGNGAGIGGGNGEWFGRKDGGNGGTVNISGDAIVKAYSSLTGSSAAAGIGCGRYGDELSSYEGNLRITGNDVVVTTQGKYSIYTSDNTTAIATPTEAWTVVDYGSADTAYSIYSYDGEVNLLSFDDKNIKDYAYAKIYFYPNISAYYTQEDGTVSKEVKAYDGKFGLPDTIGSYNGTTYCIVYGDFVFDKRPVVKGDAVLIVADGCDAKFTSGITVEEGNTLTITTGDTTNVYQRTGTLDVGSNSTSNAAIGSTQPDGETSDYAGHTAGTINIYDGDITAHVADEGSDAETFAAAIGGGAGNGNAGVVNIIRGKVKAYSAYSGTGNGAGIGGGNGDWFKRRDGGMGGTVTISGDAKVEAYSSLTGSSNAAGIGYGHILTSRLGDYGYTGSVSILGDSAEVIAKGSASIYGTPMTVNPNSLMAIIEYGESADDYSTYADNAEINLSGFNSPSTMMSYHKYAKIYFTKCATLAEALAGVEDSTYIISDNIEIIHLTTVDSIFWSTDLNGNWVKIVCDPSDYETLKSYAGRKTLKGGTIFGTMSHLDTNPVLTIDRLPAKMDYTSFQGSNSYLMEYNFSEAEPDEIATFTGLYFIENGVPKLRAYSGRRGGTKGQSLVLDITKYVNDSTGILIEGQQYHLYSAVQINEPWDKEDEAENAPYRVKRSDTSSYFTNYTAYVLDIPWYGTQGYTDVDESALNKEVKSVKYVNLSGMERNEPWDGVNIVVTTYTDGTTSTAKVVR